jgi:hypothetical protein
MLRTVVLVSFAFGIACTPVDDAAGEGEGEGEPSASLSVLLIGNSQLGLNPPDVAAALASMSLVAHDGATTMSVDREQNFGEACADFIARPEVTAAASAGDHDLVVLMPAIGETEADAGCWDEFRALAQDAGSTFAIMATAHVLAEYPEGFDALHDDVAAYAAAEDVLLVPAGRVWREVLGDAPSSEALSRMYSSDAQHPGAEGDLLYVYTLYAALSGRTAVGLPVDAVELRCSLTIDEPCMTYAELDACVDDDGAYDCAPQNGALFGPNGVGVSFVTAAEAAGYQAAVDAVLGG